MLKLLIVDDEPSIVELIKNLIVWDELDLALYGTACNGPDALRMVEVGQPDIIITDIRMPGLSGLEFIERVQQFKPGCAFIVISGYNEFEYAQQALRLGVGDYLLKPIRQDNLNTALRRLAERKQRDANERRQSETARRELREQSELLQSHLLKQALAGWHTLDEEERSQLESYVGGGCHCVLILQMSCFSHMSAAFGAFGELLRGVSDGIAALLDRHGVRSVCCVQGNRCYFLCGFPMEENPWEALTPSVQTYLREQMADHLSIELSMAAGCEAQSLRALDDSIRTARQALGYRLRAGAGGFIRYDCLSEQERLHAPRLSGEQKEKLRVCVAAVDAERCADYVKTLIERSLQSSVDGAVTIYPLAEAVIDTVYACLRGETGDEAAARFQETRTGCLDRVNNCGKPYEVGGELVACVREAVQRFAQMKENEESRPIREAKQYIVRNIDKQIGLDEVAELASMNPTYFSTLFKNKTGETFSAYLIKARLDQAKYLLKTTSLSVSEIAGRVGYADPKHFSKLFIKTVGIKPVEYRKFHS